MGQDVAEKPLKDARVAMNGDIDFIVLAYFLKALIEVLHITDK